MRIRAIVVGLAMFGFAAGFSQRAYADFCFVADNGVGYQLQLGTANQGLGVPIVVSGTRVFSTLRLPVFGSLIVKGSTILISIAEVFDFGSGIWLHPEATTVFTFPPAPALPAFDTTGHGNGAPNNVTGLLDLTGCPLPPSPTASNRKDPNAK